MVVPIENSILYVSPLYLRARPARFPELKRVIAAYGDRVVMEETLGRRWRRCSNRRRLCLHAPEQWLNPEPHYRQPSAEPRRLSCTIAALWSG